MSKNVVPDPDTEIKWKTIQKASREPLKEPQVLYEILFFKVIIQFWQDFFEKLLENRYILKRQLEILLIEVSYPVHIRGQFHVSRHHSVKHLERLCLPIPRNHEQKPAHEVHPLTVTHFSIMPLICHQHVS